jgi:hypothetical protein
MLGRVDVRHMVPSPQGRPWVAWRGSPQREHAVSTNRRPIRTNTWGRHRKESGDGWDTEHSLRDGWDTEHS